MKINYKKLNPVGFHLLKLMQDVKMRNIILWGGSSSGKTFSASQMILVFTLWEGSNHLVMKKVGAHIKDTVYKSFKAAADQLGIKGLFKFTDGTKTITCLRNGAQIVFKGLDDSEKIKGLESFKRVFLDEMNAFTPEDFKQVRKRLRGSEGQQIIGAFNPDKETCWIKAFVFDIEPFDDISMDVEINGKVLPKELTAVKSIKINRPRTIMHPRTGEMVEHPSDTILIQSTYLNNFWVVGSPDGTYGFYDEQCVGDFERDRLNFPDFYNVYALGEWGVIRTGAEFFSAFERGKHCADVSYDPSLPIHVSVDNNRLPYIAISFWQVDYTEGIRLRQFNEIPAESPNNSATKAGKLAAEYIRSLNPENVFLHGDASTRNGSTVDDENRSFLDKFISSMADNGVEVVDKVGHNNPSVPMTGEFINAIFEGLLPGLEITIGNGCKVSIEDYLSVQKDANGAIVKSKVKNKLTGQTYEEHGHFSDTFRYVCHDLMNSDYIEFANRRKRNIYARDGLIQYYNPSAENKYSGDILYFMPSIGVGFAYAHGRLCGQKWHIVDAKIVESESVDTMEDMIRSCGASTVVIESPESYFPFVRRLRASLSNIKAKKIKADIPRRISATSDLVKTMLLFNPEMVEQPEYGRFVANLLDYGSNPDSVEAGAVISGFIEFASKWIK